MDATSSRATAQFSESGSQMGHPEEEEEEARMVLIPCLPAIRTAPPDVQLAREEGKLGWVKFVLKWILFILSFPFMVAFTWTIPNCSENRKWYHVVGSFVMSIVWIAILSFAMVTIVARVGCILQIGEFTMGLVVVAIGTSVPVSCSKTLIHLLACSLLVSCPVHPRLLMRGWGLGMRLLVCVHSMFLFHVISLDLQIKAWACMVF